MDVEALALELRAQLAPGLSPLEPVPLERLASDTPIEGARGAYIVRARGNAGLGFKTYGTTAFSGERAWIWLNREAWAEFHAQVPRTRFTVAHELGHIVLHGADELAGLNERAEPEHRARLEAEANRFAAHLLVPDAALKRLASHAERALRPEDLSARFGVSVLAAGRRLQEWAASG